MSTERKVRKEGFLHPPPPPALCLVAALILSSCDYFKHLFIPLDNHDKNFIYATFKDSQCCLAVDTI